MKVLYLLIHVTTTLFSTNVVKEIMLLFIFGVVYSNKCYELNRSLIYFIIIKAKLNIIVFQINLILPNNIYFLSKIILLLLS